MVFKVANSNKNPSAPQNLQRGFSAPGSDEQYSGAGPFSYDAAIGAEPADMTPVRPTKGVFGWLRPASLVSEQRGMAQPLGKGQVRPAGSMPNKPYRWGGKYANYTPYYSRGAAAYVENFGKVLVNPIGAGVVALQRAQASYGKSGQYANGAIWWSNQVIPTSINLQGLFSAEELGAILDDLQVQAVVRTTG